MEGFIDHIGPASGGFQFRLIIDSGRYLAIPSVVVEVFDRATGSSLPLNKDGGLRFKVKYEPRVVSDVSLVVDTQDQPMQRSDLARGR